MTYYLDKAEWPTVPIPHDCVINNISLSDNFLVLDFEQGISDYDSIQHICPNAKSLTIKMHLIDTFDIYQMKTRKFPKFKKLYEELDFDKLVNLVKQKRVEYLYHYVSYQSLIVNLYHNINIILDLHIDYIEYIWKM
ncbi:MAG: hypothetical protein ACOX60_03190 [Massiliimalia sp.]|jgi:hypothetical protein